MIVTALVLASFTAITGPETTLRPQPARSAHLLTEEEMTDGEIADAPVDTLELWQLEREDERLSDAPSMHDAAWSLGISSTLSGLGAAVALAFSFMGGGDVVIAFPILLGGAIAVSFAVMAIVSGVVMAVNGVRENTYAKRKEEVRARMEELGATAPPEAALPPVPTVVGWAWNF